MKILDNDVFRTAVIVLILFLSIPFVMPDRTEVYYENEAAYKAAQAGKKSVIKILDRISGFYGLKDFSKEAAALSGTDSEGALQEASAAGEGSKAPFSVISKVQSSYNKESSASDGGVIGGSSAGSQTARGSARPGGVAMRSSGPEVNAASKDGKDYDVLEDVNGRKYVLTPKGTIAMNNFLALGGTYKDAKGTVYGSGIASTTSASADTQQTARAVGRTGGASSRGISTKGGGAANSFNPSSTRSAGGFSIGEASDAFNAAASRLAGNRRGGGASGSRGGAAFSSSAAPIGSRSAEVRAAATGTPVEITQQDIEMARSAYADTYTEPAPASALVPVKADMAQTYTMSGFRTGKKDLSTMVGDSAQNVKDVKLTQEQVKTSMENRVEDISDTGDISDIGAFVFMPIREKIVTPTEEDVVEGPVKIILGNDPNKPSGVLPLNKEQGENMTKELLGGQVLEAADGRKHTWLIPSYDANSMTPGQIFYEVNKAALDSPAATVPSDVWREADRVYGTIAQGVPQPLDPKLRLPYAVINGGNASDGYEGASRGSYFDSLVSGIVGPHGENVANGKRVRMDDLPENTIYLTSHGQVIQGKNDYTAVYEGFVVNPARQSEAAGVISEIVTNVITKSNQEYGFKESYKSN